MTQVTPIDTVLRALETEGRISARAAAGARAALLVHAEATPWYIHTLLAIAAWLAMALFIIALVGLDIVDGAESSAVTGGILLTVATAMRRLSESAFVAQLSLAAMLAGLILLGVAAASHYDVKTGALVLLVLCAALIALFPDGLARFLCVLGGLFGLAVLIHAWHVLLAMHAAATAAAALLAWLWLRSSPAEDSGSAALTTLRRPLVYGLAVGLIGLLAPSTIVGELSRSHVVPSPWLGTLGVSAVLLVSLRHVAGTLALDWTRRPVVWLVGLAMLVAALTWSGPGITAAVLLLVLGQHREDRALIGIGVLSAVANLSAYYYSLHLTLLEKSISMFAAGVVLLIARAMARRGGDGHA